MYNASLPVPRAYAALLETTKGSLSTGKARQFALTWLAAARMVTLGSIPTLTSFGDLSSLSVWKTLQTAGLPVEDLLSMFDKQSGGLPAPERPLEIVCTLYKELGSALWDVVPTLGAASGAKEPESNDAIAPVAELMLDLLGAPDNGDLWLPFDSHGLLAIRALRRGWRVNAAQMMDVGEPVALKLLLAIEHGRPEHPRVHTAVSRDLQGRPTTTARHVMAVPPIRIPVRHSRLAQWDTAGTNYAEQFDRSESMAVHELLHRVTGRAVFLVPAGVLFTSGQDQRLREAILNRGGECDDLEAVIALPSGAYSSASIASAILVVGHSLYTGTGTRLVDLGIAKRGKADIAQTVKAGRELALGLVTDTSRSCHVTRDEFWANEHVLSPSRYLTKKVTVGPNAVALGDLCTLIRAPAPVKGDMGDEAVEVGIPELSLGRWRPLGQLLDKRVLVRSTGKDMTSLQAGDLLLSVKGTVGKTGLLGELGLPKVVASQSCIALRVNRDSEAPSVSPAYLLMYLRSKEAHAQLEALKVGSTVQHVSIATLLEAFKVPVPSRPDQERVLEDYEQLCTLEAEIAELEARVERVVKSRWTVA